ncbi:arginyl-tRNA synthetase [Pilibacter termitis]|uniref:Arginine--tRNA ligase n=1 Tax=Pilibacter termitis TaxID=263852 RepID=A0A1T4LAG5_9ENTE|nr:arginine--tRNA ligase [Pilibacter termitis]SJZ51583.1 arginyl-tRNA synthetase [Pilibacter termitis]
MSEKQLVAQAIAKALDGELSAEEILNLLENPKSKEHGDVAFPTFSLAKKFRKAPQMIAAELEEKLEKDAFENVEVAGAYLNFFLDKQKVSSATLSEIITLGEKYGQHEIGQNRKVPIDLSSPNIAKPFSMGHLRSTMIGNSLAKIYEKIGFVPVKINHLGDWGKQFGMLMTAYKKWGDKETVEKNPIQELLKLYVRVNAEAKQDEEIDAQGRAWFKRLEDGDPEAQELWSWFREESLVEFNRIYNKLGVEFDSLNGEAFYNDKMDEIVEILEEKNLLKESKGALLVDLEKYDLPPALIKKTDGATLYITRDLAAALYRKRTYDFYKVLYAVGNEQSNHFKQLKAVLAEMDFDWAKDIIHVPFGLITLGGKKLSTREGKVVLLEEVLDEADALALSQIEAKNPELANKEKIAHQVGTGAVIFHDLKNDRLNSFDFDLDEVVRFEGETGPYVQYTRARSMSILRKANFTLDVNVQYSLNDKDSWEVVKLLKQFPEIVVRAAEKYEPSVIAKHSIQIAQAFNKYYAQVRILDENEELPNRLALVHSVAVVLKESLRLLGVEAPDEM